MNPLFSIIVVSLNPGDLIVKTLKSIQSQTFTDYEVIIKDGGSNDDSLNVVNELFSSDAPFYERISQYVKKDTGIYDAMNQGIELAKGSFLYFLNCGDCLKDENVLMNLSKAINPSAVNTIYYGDIFNESLNTIVSSNPKIDGFSCYRYIPCHQAIFYSKDLFSKRGYKPQYRVRGDYEHFLYSFYEKKASFFYTGLIISTYEGGGFSETKKNLKRSKEEHKEITKIYMSKAELFKYKAILAVTLAPLRTALNNSKTFSGAYNKLKSRLYKENTKEFE